MSDFLKEMAALSAARAAQLSSFRSADLDRPLAPFAPDRFEVIAEIKERSPAEGALSRGNGDRVEQARQYARGGAAAISVLTEPTRFAGDMRHLEDVVAAVPCTPVMRKDFLVDAAQVLEARKAGASGVLLIATMLRDAGLRAMLDCAYEHGMFVLLESFDENDLARCRRLLDNANDGEHAAAGRLLFGVNTRNLRTLEVDGDRLRRLAPQLPEGRCVAESGLRTAADAAAAAGWGYSMALVGSALMRSDDPAALVRAMRDAGAGASA